MEAGLSFDPRLEAVLARLAEVEPAAAAAAVDALAAVLEGVAASAWPEVAWRFSRLTDDGYPVEFAWSSRDEAVRWTAEVAGPEVEAAARPALARAKFSQLTGGAAPDPGPDRRSTPAPRFGAWLAGRHDAGASRYKLYLEGACAADWKEPLEAALGRRAVWRMTGHDAHGLEHYGRVTGLTRWGLARGCAALGLDAGPLFGLGLDRDHDEPFGHVCGFSIAETGGKPSAITLFPAWLRVRNGPDALSRLLSAAAALGSPATVLRALAGGGAQDCGRLGLVGIGCTADGLSWLQAGWRPGAARPAVQRIGSIRGSENGPLAPGPCPGIASASTRTA